MLLVSLFGTAGLLLTGCASSGVNITTPVGMIYNGTTMGVAAKNNIPITKTGKSCYRSLFGISVGDATVAEAMKNGDIKHVATIDHSKFDILIYGITCVVIAGN